MASSRGGTGWAPILLEAARGARSRALRALRMGPHLDVADLKRLLDSEAHDAIEETVRRSGIPAHLVSEEGEGTFGGGGDCLIVDPVDGTTNLAKGIPFAAVSLAASEAPLLSAAVAAVVMDIRSGAVYRAERGRGAWRGRRRIRTSAPKALSRAVVSIDISKGGPLTPLEGLIAEAGHLRQLGSAALSLCLVASGIMDAHVDLRGVLRATDVAGGLLVLKEAGGAYALNGVPGGDLELSRQSTLTLVAASGGAMLEEVLRRVEGG